jgi:hypothetical protein
MSSSYNSSLLDHLATHTSPLHHDCCAALLSFRRAGLSLPVASPLSLASLPHVPLLADCCVHPPLLPPPTAVTKKSLRQCMPRCECVMSSTPLLMSALSSFRCSSWLLPNTLPLMLTSLPLLCPCQPPPLLHWHEIKRNYLNYYINKKLLLL